MTVNKGRKLIPSRLISEKYPNSFVNVFNQVPNNNQGLFKRHFWVQIKTVITASSRDHLVKFPNWTKTGPLIVENLGDFVFAFYVLKGIWILREWNDCRNFEMHLFYHVIFQSRWRRINFGFLKRTLLECKPSILIFQKFWVQKSFKGLFIYSNEMIRRS